jgi:hypothetical protein
MNPNAPESAKRPPFTDGAGPSSPGDAFAAASARLAEIKDYASYYLAAKLDSYKSSAKSLVLYAALGLLGAIAGTAILATAGVLVVRGIAEGLTLLFGGRAWLGNLVTGVVLLAAILGTTYFLVARILGKSRSATVKKYQDLQRQQLAKHGHNVHERAQHANQH